MTPEDIQILIAIANIDAAVLNAEAASFSAIGNHGVCFPYDPKGIQMAGSPYSVLVTLADSRGLLTSAAIARAGGAK